MKLPIATGSTMTWTHDDAHFRTVPVNHRLEIHKSEACKEAFAVPGRAAVATMKTSLTQLVRQAKGKDTKDKPVLLDPDRKY